MFPPSGNIVMNFEDKVTGDRAAQELDEKIPETEVRKVGYIKPKIMLCNANTYHLVFKCEPEVRKAIHENRDEIKFAFAVYHVRDRYHVRICTYCQRFGHIERNCIHKNHEPFCGKCSENHATKDCQADFEKCIICVRKKKTHTSHRVGSRCCESLQEEQREAASKTDHGY